MIGEVLQAIFSATFLGAILRVATPILLPSLGALISERAGVINIGLEGIMLVAAFSGATIGALTQSPWIGFMAACVLAVLSALLLAFFHLELKGDLILGGIAVNILGSAGTIAIAYALTGDRAGGIQLTPVRMPDVTLSFLQSIPVIGPALYTVIGEQNLMTWLAFLSVAAIWFMLYRMPIGRHLRATGENPDAAASVGINVKRMRYLALALSGLVAGLGGIHMSMGYLSGFTRDMTAGRGYIALVAPALGNGTPLGTMIAAVLFGTFYALSIRLPNVVPEIPSQFVRIIPYLGAVIALVLYSVQRQRAAVARMRRIEEHAA